MQLSDKIEHEYTLFRMGCLITSRENIFIHAEEISLKKYIYLYLKEMIPKLENEDNIIASLISMDNVLDNAYGYVQELFPQQIEVGLKNWLRNFNRER
ncbi:hypothetical protein [Robinsoniella peoriensis]